MSPLLRMSNLRTDRGVLRNFYLIVLVMLAILATLMWQRIQLPQRALVAVQEKADFEPVKSPIQPIPSATFAQDKLTQNKLALGEKLFEDRRLSKDNQISCASCHALTTGGVDRKRYSVGVNAAVSAVNTPTVFNVAYNFRFNWDGEYSSLIEHTDMLMQKSTETGRQWPEILQTLQAIPEYRQTFAQIYNDGITRTNVIDAIVAYETTLVTPDAPFDRYLQGDQSALSSTEQEGYRLFRAYGCISCHQGVNVGGNIFQKFGVIGDYFADRGNVIEADFGRFNITQLEADRFVFRVPSLRNVAVTPPYFHDGNAETLEQAIKIMVKYQLGRTIPPEDLEQIAQFLQTLTGEYKGVSLEDSQP